MKRLISSWARIRTFTGYYRANHWADAESRSGPGSRRDSGSVEHALRILAMITERYGVRTIADIPCGDFNWIGRYLDAWPSVAYVGFDIVSPLIDRNRALFPEKRFTRLDIVCDVPPHVDLIFCKDLFNHLESREIVKAIANMRRSGSTYLLASNNFGYPYEALRRTRHDSSRHVDLTLEPFCYAAPLWHDHYLGLWQLAEMEGKL